MRVPISGTRPDWGSAELSVLGASLAVKDGVMVGMLQVLRAGWSGEDGTSPGMRMVLPGCPDHNSGELFLRLTVTDQVAGVSGDCRIRIPSLL